MGVLNVCDLCVRELGRIVKVHKEQRNQEEMKRLREEELKKKSKKLAKKDNKEASKKKSLVEGKQVCMCIPFLHENKIQCELKYIQAPISTHK